MPLPLFDKKPGIDPTEVGALKNRKQNSKWLVFSGPSSHLVGSERDAVLERNAGKAALM